MSDQSVSKKMKLDISKESIFIVDARETANSNTRSYIFDFGEVDVPARVWQALMSLKLKKKFHFPNVGDSGFAALNEDIKDRRDDDEDFQNFFSDAMQDVWCYPRKGDTMETPGHCSWMVFLQEE